MCPDFRGGAKKQPVPWPGGPGYNGAFANDTVQKTQAKTEQK